MALIKITTTDSDPDAIFEIAVPIATTNVSTTKTKIAKVGSGDLEIEVATAAASAAILSEYAQENFTNAVDAAVADPYVIPTVSVLVTASDEYLAPDTVVAIKSYS